jgi:hypothetical protein
MQPFTIHWSPVPGALAGMELFALWPSPMNDDICFREAGFTDFDDADESWDVNAAGLLTRLLEALSNYGPPRLMSEPATKHQPWYRRWFTKSEEFDLRRQIELPILWDQLPDCIVAFGESGVTLRTGTGHHIFWVTLPHFAASSFPALAGRLAASHPIARTELRWDGLVNEPKHRRSERR